MNGALVHEFTEHAETFLLWAWVVRC